MGGAVTALYLDSRVSRELRFTGLLYGVRLDKCKPRGWRKQMTLPVRRWGL